MAAGNGRCPLPRQPHSPSRKADTQTPSGSNHSLRRRTRGLKIPETARSPTPGLRHAHGRCSLFLTVQASTSPCPSQPRTCTPAATLQPSRLVPAEKRASGRCVDRNRHASSARSRRLKSPNMCQGNLSFRGEGMSRRHPRRTAHSSQQTKPAKSSGICGGVQVSPWLADVPPPLALAPSLSEEGCRLDNLSFGREDEKHGEKRFVPETASSQLVRPPPPPQTG